MDINDLILSDEALDVVDNGTWVPAGDEAPSVEFLVVGLQSEPAQKMIKQKQAVLRQKNRGKPLSDDQLATTMKETLVECILKDWRGLVSNGEEVPYSKDLAKQWIMSRNGAKFTDMVINASRHLSDAANDFVGEVTKN